MGRRRRRYRASGKDGFKRFDLEYESLGEAVRASQNDRVWYADNKESEVNQLGYSFSHTESMDEAYSLALHGWHEGTQRMVRDLDTVNRHNVQGRAPDFTYDVAGSRPFIPHAVAGLPDSMIRPAPESDRNKPIVRLAVQGFVTAMVDPKQVENYGVAILSHIDRLEHDGNQVELIWCLKCASDRSEMCIKIPVKRPGERVELDRVAFMLAHPAMTRRIGFSLYETISDPEAKRRYSYGYGYAKPIDREADRLEGSYVLPGPDMLGASVKNVSDCVAELTPIFDEALASAHGKVHETFMDKYWKGH